jgi:hypothetical protein
VDHSIYLIVEFSFPRPFQPDYGAKAKALNQALKGLDWVQEVFAASGGVGGGPSSVWVFKLANYAALDRLFHGDEPVSKAYVDFFRSMADVNDTVREAITFS